MESVPQQGEFFRHPGFCPLCEKSVCFVATGPYFRNTLKCDGCGSLPRSRALMKVLIDSFPSWRDCIIHESSPGWDMVSQRLARECKTYYASQYDTSVPAGTMVDAPRFPFKRYQSENLEEQTYADEQFHVVITQDVFEHIFRPDLAIREISRTLKPGGAVVMTVPLVNRRRPSKRRALLVNGEIQHIAEPQFHGNPLGNKGSLVTIDWGYDIVSYLHHHSRLSFIILQIDNIDLGIRADLNEVLIGYKLPAGNLL